MSEASNQQIFQAIGSLQADVTGLRRDFQAGETRAVESIRRADEHRTAIHKRVDDAVDVISALESRMASMESTVAESKMVTDEVKQWKQRGIGALAMAGMAGTAIGGSVAAFIAYWWDEIGRLLRAG